MEELWKDVVGYEGIYKVSNTGQVASVAYGPKGSNHFLNNKQRTMKQYIKPSGYHQIMLYKDNIPKVLYVHRIVAEAFIPNPENKKQVNHKNGDKSDNRVDNLEWATAQANTIHAIHNGLRPVNQTKGKRYSDNPRSKTVWQFEKDGHFVREWKCVSEAALYYGVTKGALGNAARGLHKSCAGFVWKYPNNS